MNNKIRLILSFLRLTVLLILSGLVPQTFAQGTAFTFQGQFNDNGGPATGFYDLKFTLFSVISGGSAVAGPATNSAVGVTNGLFSVVLDFGQNFPGADRFLEIAARSNGAAAFTTLLPRQKITPVPYAITAGNLTGTVPGSGLSGVYSNALTLNDPANSFSGDGSGLTSLNASRLSSGTVGDGRLSANVALLNASQTFTADKFFGSGAQLLADVGSVTAPSLSFAGDPNTGIFRPNANALAFAGNGVEHFRIDSFGAVGIGTTNPVKELEIHGPGDVEIGIKSTDTDGHLWTIQSTGVTGNTTRDASFQIIDRTLGTSRLLIGTNGLVGIGTPSPGARLHVDGGTDASTNSGGYIVIGATNGFNIALDNNEIMARNNGAKAALNLNAQGGNVYIGGVFDGALSTIYLDNPVLTEQSVKPIHDGIHNCGDSGNRWFELWAFNGFVQTSDVRAKTNIQSVPYGLETVLSLRPVSFEWKQTPRRTKNLGLIAQEVEPLVPEAVVKDANPEHQAGMNYSAFIPVLIKAIQDQQTLIQNQRTLLQEQQSQMRELEGRLRRIEEKF